MLVSLATGRGRASPGGQSSRWCAGYPARDHVGCTSLWHIWLPCRADSIAWSVKHFRLAHRLGRARMALAAPVSLANRPVTIGLASAMPDCRVHGSIRRQLFLLVGSRRRRQLVACRVRLEADTRASETSLAVDYLGIVADCGPRLGHMANATNRPG